MFWHDATKSLTIAYVDDFKLAARAELRDEAWAAIKSVIGMGDETTDGRFLGGVHERNTRLPRCRFVSCWGASRSAIRARSETKLNIILTIR